MGRDIHRLLHKNKIAIEQIQQILTKEAIDEEYSRLAIAMKQGGVFAYDIAYKSLTAMLTGIADNMSS